jgi:hypothetical protein
VRVIWDDDRPGSALLNERRSSDQRDSEKLSNFLKVLKDGKFSMSLIHGIGKCVSDKDVEMSVVYTLRFYDHDEEKMHLRIQCQTI